MVRCGAHQVVIKYCMYKNTQPPYGIVSWFLTSRQAHRVSSGHVVWTVGSVFKVQLAELSLISR